MTNTTHTIGNTFFDTEADCWSSTIMFKGVAVSYVYADTKDEVNTRAAFIVQACNSHEALLESLTEMVRSYWGLTGGEDLPDFVIKARNAITLATKE